jgi:hypothetical protein
MRSWEALQDLAGTIPETSSSLYVEGHEAINCGKFSLTDRRGASFRFLASGTADIWTDLDSSGFGWGEATPLAIDTCVTLRAVLVHLPDTGNDPIQRSLDILRETLSDSAFRPDSYSEMRRSGGQVFGYQVRLKPIVEP